jgi:diguanylate cyclase (GGDEF)-like protein
MEQVGQGSKQQGSSQAGVVLVADDSRLVRRIIAGCLSAAGHDVTEAENGAVALSQLKRTAFDVVITNLNMPELSGLELLKAIREQRIGAEVIILTGTDGMDSAVKALRLGAHDYLLKPARLEEVVLTVERALEKKRLRDENARLVRELAALSRTDFLTGLPNRRTLDDSLTRELSRAQRYGLPLSVAMLDIDHFKKVNDTYGHNAGDAVLQEFARLASETFRDADAVYRYGGEEFAVLLPHADLEGARAACQRFVELVARAAFKTPAGPLKLTCSAGLTAMRPSDGDPAELLARADRSLYQAKALGRNRVVVEPAVARRLSNVA